MEGSLPHGEALTLTPIHIAVIVDLWNFSITCGIKPVMKSMFLALCMVLCAGLFALAQAADRADYQGPPANMSDVLTTGTERAASSIAGIGRCCSKTETLETASSMSCHTDSKPFVAAASAVLPKAPPAKIDTGCSHRVFLTTVTLLRPPIT